MAESADLGHRIKRLRDQLTAPRDRNALSRVHAESFESHAGIAGAQLLNSSPRDPRSEAMHSVIRSIQAAHQSILDREPLTRGRLLEIAEPIIADIEQFGYPIRLSRQDWDLTWVIAEHSRRTASTVAFLCSADVAWRAHRESLVVAAAIQDAGMLTVPSEIYLEPTPLRPSQRALIREHVSIGSAAIGAVAGFPSQLANACLCHHERLDGSGYPAGLTSEQITPSGRLLAIADAYVAQLSARPHRPPMSAKQALANVLEESSQNQLDPGWARRLVSLGFYPVGSIVELTSGEIARVIAPHEASQTPQLATLPVVAILIDRRGDRVDGLCVRNLAHRPDCRIVRQLSASESRELSISYDE